MFIFLLSISVLSSFAASLVSPIVLYSHGASVLYCNETSVCLYSYRASVCVYLDGASVCYILMEHQCLYILEH